MAEPPKTPPLPTDQPGRITVVGITLYGAFWRRRLADGLGISRDTLHRWLQIGGANTDRDIDGELVDLLDAERDACAERSIEITALRRRLVNKR